MKVVAFRHLFSEGLGSLAQVIEKAGGGYQYIDTYREAFDSFDPLGPDLLIILGGTPGVYQADDYPFLKTEMKMMEQRLKADRPTLGICLGAQMMAEVLGGKAYRGDNGSEIGWYKITVNDSGKDTPVRHFDQAHTRMLQWHGDTFDLPPGATLLASSEKYKNQAFSYGRNALALQFHSEVTPGMLKGWSVSSADLVAQGKMDIHRLRADTDEWGPCMIAQTEKFMCEWLDRCGLVTKTTHAA